MQQNWKFRRGDIYYVQFGNTSTGSEQHGDRPAVIIQNDVGNTYAPTLIVVPLTSNTEKKVTQPTHCLLENEGLSMSSMALAEQIFTIRCVFAIPVTESSASRPTAPGRRDIPSTFWMRSLIKLSARFSPR